MKNEESFNGSDITFVTDNYNTIFVVTEFVLNEDTTQVQQVDILFVDQQSHTLTLQKQLYEKHIEN